MTTKRKPPRHNSNDLRLPRVRRHAAAVNTLALALGGAIKPTPAKVAELFTKIKAAATAMRKGRGAELDASILAGSLLLAQSIEKLGIVKGLQEHLHGMAVALKSIQGKATRSGSWQHPTLHFHELDAINTFVELHQFQISNLSKAELEAAFHLAKTSHPQTVRIVRDFKELDMV